MHSGANKIEPNIRGSMKSIDNGGNGYSDKSSLFVKNNKNKISSNILNDDFQDQSDLDMLDRSPPFIFKPKPKELVSNERIQNSHIIHDRNPTADSKTDKDTSSIKMQNLKNEKILKNEKFDEEIASMSVLSDIDSLNFPLQIKKPQNSAIVSKGDKDSLSCGSDLKFEINPQIKNPFISKESEGNINLNLINKNNKFWNALDAVFDSPKTKDNILYDFEEIDERKKNSNIDRINNHVENNLDEEDLIYFDGRNRQVFSFHNKNRNTQNTKNSGPTNVNPSTKVNVPNNIKKQENDDLNPKSNLSRDLGLKKKSDIWEVDSLPGNLNDNWSMISNVKDNNCKEYDQINKNKSKNDSMIERLGSNGIKNNNTNNRYDLKLSHLNEFDINNTEGKHLEEKNINIKTQEKKSAKEVSNFIRDSISRESLKLNLDIFKQNERKKRNKNLDDFLVKENLTNNTNNTNNTLNLINTIDIVNTNSPTPKEKDRHQDSYYDRYKIIKKDSTDERNLKTLSHSYTPLVRGEGSNSQDKAMTNPNENHMSGPVKKANQNQVEVIKSNANKFQQLQINKNLMVNTMNVNEVMKSVGNNNLKFFKNNSSHSPVSKNFQQNNKTKTTSSNNLYLLNQTKTCGNSGTPRKNTTNNINKVVQSPINSSKNITNLGNASPHSPHSNQLNNKINSNSSKSLNKDKKTNTTGNSLFAPSTSSASNSTPSNFNEKFLMAMLEEIKEKNNHVQKYFLLKETAMKREIEDLKSKLKIQIEREKNLSEEVDELKIKLAFFADDANNSKKREKQKERDKDMLLYGNTTNTTKRYCNDDSIQEKESPQILNLVSANTSASVVSSPDRKSGRPPRISLSAIPELGDFNSEEKFVQKYHVSRLKSYALLLKDIGLDPSTFYDDLLFSNKDLEDDICYDCTSAPVDHKCLEGKWNYAVVLRNYPKLKNFILLMAKKLLYDNRARLKLEEKTLKIFSNDLKAIDQLVKNKF